jgi:hypothetical protein
MIVNEWREIAGFPNYRVSNLGHIWNRRFNRPINTSDARRGFTTYKRVTLFKENTRHYKSVHRIVAEAFLPNPTGLSQVDHLDGDASNNAVGNLEWVTGSTNVRRSFQKHPAEKRAICAKGGTAAGLIGQARAERSLRSLLGERLLQFYPSGELCNESGVRYKCICGDVRTVKQFSREIRYHQGVCPACRGTAHMCKKQSKAA